MMFHVFHIGGRPRLAVPAGRRELGRAAARRFQPGTARRKAFRMMVDAAMLLGAERLLSRLMSDPLAGTPGFENFPLHDWVREAQSSLGREPLHPAIVWPPQADRGRVYVHLLEDSGSSVAFAKIAAHAEDRMLDAEAAALTRIAELHLRRARPPRLLASSAFADRRYVLMEPLPEHGRPVRIDWPALAPVAAEFAGDVHTLGAKALHETDWWGRAELLRQRLPALHAFLETAVEANGVEVCMVHGDFGCHNLLRDGDQLWLYDWEHSSECGPRRTDEVNFWIGQRQRLILKDPAAGFDAFARRFLNDDLSNTCKAAAALMYLCAGEISPAMALAQSWPEPA